MGIIISLIVVFFASVLITRASDAFEVAADYVGRNLTDGVKGATINAIGSSMPELFTTFIFLVVLNDANGFAGGIGTTAGSAVFNGLIIPSLVGIVVIVKRVAKHIELSKKVILRDGISLIICEAILIYLLNDSVLTIWHGAVLVALYLAYIVVLLVSMKKRQNKRAKAILPEEVKPFYQPAAKVKKQKSLAYHLVFFKWLDLQKLLLRDAQITTFNAWMLLIASTVLTGVACHWLVEACIWLGSDDFQLLGFEFDGLNLPIYFLSVIIASAATSLPDTILSLKDAQKGNYNDAVSNALGSNIFDICFALGFPLFIFCLFNGEIHLSSDVINSVAELRILLLFLTIISFFVFYMGSKFGIVKACILLFLYIIFVLFIVGDTLDWSIVEGLKDLLVSINAKITH